MSLNPDELILLSKKVSPMEGITNTQQAMRIALYNEYRSKAFCKRVIEIFENPTPFPEILDSTIYHIDILYSLFIKKQVPTPIDDWYEKLQVYPSIIENCEVGMSYEISKIEMYNHLIEFVQDEPELKDIFYKLQAASYNYHQPSYRMEIANNLQKEKEYQGEDIWKEAYESFQKGRFSSTTFLKLLDKFKSEGNQDLGLVLGILLSKLLSQEKGE